MSRPVLELPSAAMLTHFTRRSTASDALDNLVAILRTGIVRGSRRMVRTKRAVVCLFDAPWSELNRLLVPDNRRRYEPFGIAVDKRYAFAMGARPVIYLPWLEACRMLDEHELWRVVGIDLEHTPPLDWTFEREWRIPEQLRLPDQGTVALVESWRDVDELYDRFDGTPPCAGIIPLRSLFGST
ncbi:MAG TPA: hypothetical protein VJ728_10570 [Candidatus Binataceae bacterium]|nr:hypothetical protein [Candidatus Binataceae bacterium]